MHHSPFKAIVIGGSAGSFQGILRIVESLPRNISIPIYITLHRLKHERTGLAESVSLKSHIPIVEPFDKEAIEPGTIYLAPANYHMFIEKGLRISLSTEEAIEFSRPSIDIMFTSAAEVYESQLLAILLSGANKDGAQGVKTIKKHQGTVIIQDPSEAEIDIMPRAAMQMIEPDYILSFQQIIDFIQKM